MRRIRNVKPGGELKLLLVRTRQDCPFLRPDREGNVNRLVLGALAQAQKSVPLRLLGFVVLPHEVRIFAWPRETAEMRDFMHHLDTNLSKEVGRLDDVRQSGGFWRDRYRSVDVSDAPEDQVACLKELLAAPCEALFVERPGGWPGVHCLGALLHGESLRGVWHDRTNGTVEELEVRLTPLPCWGSLSEKQRRAEVAKLARAAEDETARGRQRSGLKTCGARAVLELDPRQGPEDVPRWSTPAVFSLAAATRRRLRQAYEQVLAAYRRAAESLRRTNPDFAFPPGTFPPPLPYAPPSGEPP